MTHATIRDVARLAGVSVASVSRALNGLSNVRPEMRARVEAAARELHFMPHAGARSLSLSKAHAVGVVLPDLHGEFFSEVLRGIDSGAHARGYQLLLSNMRGDPETARQAFAAMRGRVDGLIVMAPTLSRAEIDGMIPPSTPAVFVNSVINPDRMMVVVDNVAGAYAATRHLLDLGRRRILHIRGPVGNIDAEEREIGYRRAVAEAANAGAAKVVAGNFTEDSGACAVQTLIEAGNEVEAIFAANDAMAFGAIRALGEAGRRVPDDVAIVGFDDVPAARHTALTTMQVNMAEIGVRCAERVIDAIEGRVASPAIERVLPILMVRRTTTG